MVDRFQGCFGVYHNDHSYPSWFYMLTRYSQLLIDAEKKKYFKVQANHVAPDSSKYSRQNVKKEKEESRVCHLLIMHLFTLFNRV